jgi:hypothetical protein
LAERKEPSYNSRRVFPKLWKAGHHSEIALIQQLTAVPLDLAGTSALLLFGSTVQCHGGVRKRKRNRQEKFYSGSLLERRRWSDGDIRRGLRVGADIAWRLNSDHHQLDPSVFKAFPCQTIPRHLFDPVPVLTEIAGSLILG